MLENWRYLVLAFAVGACGGSAAAPAASADNIAGLPDATPAAADTGATSSAAPPTAGAAPDATSVVAATAAAKSWLALVDAEKYADSWHAAADAFQSAVSSDDWAKAVGAVRHPLGKLVSRQVDVAEYKTSLPGAPDGKYVVVRFKTVFENKAQATETVTPSQAADGTWKVSGYFVK